MRKRLIIFLVLFASQSTSSQLNKTINPPLKDDKGSLVFVFDTTGSMFNDLKQLREGAEMILKTALEESNIIADFVFVPFHDPAIGPATVTTQKEVFKSALNIVRVYGGGDCPERSLGGIQLALNVSRPRSFVYVFTDATASDHRIVDKVLDNIQRKQSQVVFVLTGHCNDVDKPSYKVYQQIAAASSGQIFNLNKTSVFKVLEFVRSSIKGRIVNLGSAINPAGYNYTQKIPVDKTVDEVTVSVSGSAPQIHLVSPSGEEVTGPPQLVTILDLSEIMIVSVLSPAAGVWGVRAGSTAPHSVRVRARSEVDVMHGFSVARVTDLKETSYRPLKGTYNYMLISLSSNGSIKLDHAELLDLKGKLLFEIPLKEVDAAHNVYMADAFIPPEDFFNIAVVGVDSSGQIVRRAGRTAVSAADPDVPYLVVPKKVVASVHSRVVLRCAVESLVPVRATWTRRGRDLHAHTHSLQSTTVEHVIEDMSEGYVGTYRCIASNAAGQATADTGLDMIVTPPQVLLSSVGEMFVLSRLVVSCSVYSDAYVQRARIEFEGTSRRYATDFRLEPSINGFYTFNITIESASEVDSGVYTCLAVNRGGVSNQSTSIIILPKPTAVILGPHTVTKLIHSHMQLVCHVDNAKQILWMYNDYLIEKKDINGSYNAMLNLDNVKEDGTWTCKAIMGAYIALDSVNVTVHIKPQVTIIGSKNISLSQNSTYDVTCSVVARPQPRVLWHRETEEFLYHVLTNPEPNVYRTVLTVNGTAATYFCFGENIEGIGQDSVVVNIYTPMVVVEGLTDTSVELYSPVKFLCNISASPPPTIKWYHNNTHIQTNKNKDINETNVLIIDRVDFDNVGNYSCEADNSYEKIRLNCTLSIHGLAIPMIYKEPVNIVVHKGKSLNLTCRILWGNPKPDITWQYSQNSNFENITYSMVKENSVVIHKIDKKNAGRYRCEASNVIGRDMYDVFVLVQYPPELPLTEEANKTETLMKVKSGENIRLHCNVTGDPPPVIIWTKNDLPLTYSTKLFLNSDSLVIENATKFDSGVFTCNASNILGYIEKNFTIIVYTSPIISNSTNTELQVLEGQLVELPCFATGLPGPRIRWTHNGQDINDMRRHRDEYGLRFVANLTDFGEYECIANNAFGNARLNYTLYIWVAPSIDSPLDEIINIKKYSNVSFECDAVGFPVPTMSWQFNEVILSENTSSLSFNEVGYLSITNASVSVGGTYTCVADNIAGTAIKNYVVLINEPPHFLEDEYSGVYVASTLDRDVKISCRAAGDPPPYVYWSKDGVGLHSDAYYDIDTEGTLSIKHPTEQSGGEYSCTARNTAGNNTKDVRVQIYSPPSLLQDHSSAYIMSVVEGSDLRVSCPVKGNVTVKWYKDAILISNGTLNFLNISRANSSMYACVASNVVGSVHSNVLIDVQWPPKLQDGGDVEILAGNDYYINCTTDAKPPAEIRWLFNTKTLVGENKEKLSILDAKVYNSGIYRCVASNSHGTVFKDTQLHVLEPPFLSNFNYLDFELKAGANATLECNANGSPPPNITWTYNNTDWILQNTSLVSYNVTFLSEGMFVCRASNRAGSRSLVYHVVVVAAALVTEMVVFVGGVGRGVEGKVEIAVGVNARIACKASGNPEPIIQWIHNGNTVSNNTGVYADLVFKNVTTINKGTYACVASNIGGFDQKLIKIDVLESPRIFQTLFHNANSSQTSVKLEVISNQVFYLHCHPYGNPIPDIYWFKDGFPLKFYDDAMISTDFGEIIISKSAKYEQRGNYTCVARNKVDNTSISYLVDILEPPPPQKGDIKQVSTLSGTPLNITCPSFGRPPPVVMWIKHPYTDIVETARIQLLNYNYTLFFTKTVTSDSGKYSCVITNSVGTTEVVFDVVILTPPAITGNDTLLTVALGRSIVLKCHVDGVPEPKVTWFKDIQSLSPTSASQHQAWHTHVACVWRARVSHAGQYRCVAENSAGVVQRRYDVTVRVPGKWSNWSPWNYCNVTCDLGYQQRERQCQYIDDNNNIIDKDNKPVNIFIDESSCKGSAVNLRKCHMPSCEEHSSPWSLWSPWSECSSSCGSGSQLRTRSCRGEKGCSGDDLQIRKCIDLPKCKYDKERVTVDKEDIHKNDINPDYIPEVTFELQPKRLNIAQPTHIHSDDEYIHAQTSPLYEVKVTENLDHSEQGPCDPGYRYIEKTKSCEDVDECVSSLSPVACHSTQSCVNTMRGYACSCDKGYTSLGAGQRCLDVNECTQGLHGCEFACVNTAGGYVCACPQPLRLHTDRRHCVLPSTLHDPDQYDDDYVDLVTL